MKIMNEPIEEAHIREVPEERPLEEGESVVRLQKNRRKWLWIIPVILLLFFGIILLRSSDDPEDRVSLPAAKETLISEKPSLKKISILRALREDGFRAIPGPPRSPIEITVSVRRDGLILRSQSKRLWIPLADLKK